MTITSILKPLPIQDINDKKFFIPHYQRGYRWTEMQVQQLLNDIDQFIPIILNPKEGISSFYCLQPVVIKAMSIEKKQSHNLEGDWYEVIDGQQRLTTIFLIIQGINEFWEGKQKNPQFSLAYETREKSSNFLISLKQDDEIEDVLINHENIDFYYISKAYQTICNWIKSYKKNSSSFKIKFFENSKIIWYEVNSSEVSNNLFERLNLGKIPLTNAELVKALFLSEDSFNDLAEEERKIRQIEIAKLWDEIENKLNGEDEKFWAFITNKLRNKYETKIELLLDIITNKNEDKQDPYFTFTKFLEEQQHSPLLTIWDKIEQFYSTISDWYSDNELYHKIGYLVSARSVGSYKGVNLAELVTKALNKDSTKDSFKSYIDNLIQKSIDWNFKELRYDEDPDKIFNILLLFNVETNYLSEYEPYPFKFHKSKNWSLEHIHARNSEKFDKTKKEQWLEWLKHHLPILENRLSSLNVEDTNEIENVITQVKGYLSNPENLRWEKFDILFNEMHQFFNQNDDSLERDLDSLSNLALLGMNDNAALNNSIFEVKYRKIIEMDKEGKFIPICTRRIFMKYYNDNSTSQQHYFWSENDRQGYFANIENTLQKYNK